MQNKANFRTIETFYPSPGETRWDSGAPINFDLANEIAEFFYEPIALHADHGMRGELIYSVQTRGGFAAVVGMIGGRPAILHKTPSGERELEILEKMAQPIPGQ